MASLGYLVLAAACLAVNAFPDRPLPYRNTIFTEEKLTGGIFEDEDAINGVTPLNTQASLYRLPTTTKPAHYDLTWTVNIALKAFSGNVRINLYATQPNVDEIVIHAHDLNIISLELYKGSDEVARTWLLQPEYHFLRVRPVAGPLEFNATHPVIYTLAISFGAPLRQDMYGIYQSWFKNSTSEQEIWMASTQFQATAARFAFPCYDEPSFKATFDITIRRPSGYYSWSCMRINNTLPYNGGYFTDVYYTTPVMSTYLLALIVAPYGSLPVRDDQGRIVYEVIARPEALESGQGYYAFDAGQRLLERMNTFTEIDFNSTDNIKMTQAAIPDFSAGAMENWGLLTYREAYLLYTEADTNSYFKQLIAYILSHEIAHMWFGNLVTCEWWDVLWLNEGFARYFQYFLTDWVETYMGLGRRFINEQVHTSLLADSADNPQPLTNPGVGSPASVSAMFSTISYNKGAAVIRMTEHLMGSENHRLALNRYLVKRSHQTASPMDLFEDLQEYAVESNAISQYGASFNIPDYYKTWTEQPGHPVLNVDVNRRTGDITVYQRRFNINSGYSTARSNWIVPITFATASNSDFNNTKPSHIIREAITVLRGQVAGEDWIIFNKQQTGFYRVNYDEYTWDLISLQLRGENREIVHEHNRAQIVDDVFQFARSGIMNYTRALNILSFMRNETSYTPWVAFITGFNWLHSRFIGTETESLLAGIFIDWSRNVMSELTYSPDEDEEEIDSSRNVMSELTDYSDEDEKKFMRSYLRYQLAPVLCRLNETGCREAAREQFANFTAGGNVPVDSRNWVYCNGLRDGTEADFQMLWNRFLTHDVYTEKILLLQVLGCTPHRNSLYRFLDSIFEENFEIRRQDYSTAYNSAVTGNEGNTQLVFEYIQAHTTLVANAFNSIAQPLATISSRLRTPQEIAEFRAWADANQGDLGTSYRGVIQGIESTEASLRFAESIKDFVETAILEEVPPVSTSTPAPTTTTTLQTFTLPNIQAPSTPNLPDSASTSLLSTLVLTFAAFLHFTL